jgi:hypothetical protein
MSIVALSSILLLSSAAESTPGVPVQVVNSHPEILQLESFIVNARIDRSV